MNYSTGRPAYAASASGDRASDALWVTYRWMTLGLAVTGLVAMGVASSPSLIQTLVGNRILFFGLLIGQVGLVVAFSSMATRVSAAAAGLMFFSYAALTGVTFATLFLVYTATSIATTFFVTAGAFGGLSAFGAVTRRDLSGFGRFAIFALVGIVLASVVNMFVRSSGLDWIVSVVGVVLFAGLTAYDTQRIKAMMLQADSGANNLPLIGALTLYLDFINMFLFLLRFMGDRRRN
jgi:FtsH-binding integral membrane protein